MAECSICSCAVAAPDGTTVREMVDRALDEKCFLDDIAAKVNLLLAQHAPGLSIHRSSIHRHAKKCYTLRERAARLKERESESRTETRIFVEWPEHVLFGELAGKITSSDFDDADAIAPCRERDVLLTVTFEQGGQKATQNQPELKPQEPPEGEETMPEEKKTDGVLAKLYKLLTGTGDKPEQAAAPAEPPKTLEQIQSTCQHAMSPAVDGGRCIHCGFQPAKWRPVGLSRADFSASRRRF